MLYIGGEHITIINKYVSTILRPHSLGFICSCIPFSKRIPLLVNYRGIFYRFGKTGKYRLERHHFSTNIIPHIMEYLPKEITKSTLDNPILSQYVGSHMIKKLNKLDLLNCDPLIFFAYLVSRIDKFDLFISQGVQENIFENGYTRNKFFDAMFSDEMTLTSSVINDNKFYRYIFPTLKEVIKEDGVINLIINKYKSKNIRMQELRQLNKLDAKFIKCYEIYLSFMLQSISTVVSYIRNFADKLNKKSVFEFIDHTDLFNELLNYESYIRTEILSLDRNRRIV